VAVVGEAHIIVRAITTGVKRDIEKAFDGADQAGGRAGQRAGKSFSNGFNRGSGRNNTFKKFEKEAMDASKAFSSLATAGMAVGPLIAGAASAIAAAGAGLAALAAQAATAGPALLALGNIFGALIQGAGVLKLAFAGVGAALSAGLNDGGSKKAKTAVDNTKRISDARKRLAQTIEQAAETEERSQQTVARSWRNYQDAVVSTQKAIENLQKVQKQAAEDTQQLGFDAEDAALAEQRAAQDLEDARTQLAAVQSLPPDSKARQEAELAYKEADLNYRRAIDRNQDLKQSQDEANKAGSAGAEDIANAAEEVQSAKRDEADAYNEFQQSIIDAERARRDSARAIVDAEEALAEAMKKTGDAADAASGGLSAFEKAMAKLSPEARHFVNYLIGIQGELKKLKAAAGRKLFPSLETAIGNLVKNLFPDLEDMLEATGGVLGDVAVQLSGTITEARNMNNLKAIWSSNDKLIGNMGTTVGNLYSIMLELSRAAIPLAEDFGAWIATMTGGWKATLRTEKGHKKLNDIMKEAGRVARQLGRIFGNLFRAFKDIAVAASGPGSGGELLLNTLETATKKFENFVKKVSGDGSLQQFFLDAANNLIPMGQAVTTIAEGFLKLGNNKGVGTFFSTISKSGGAIDQVFAALEKMSGGDLGAKIGELVNKIATILSYFVDSKSIEMFFGVLNKAADILLVVFGNSIVQKIIIWGGAVHGVVLALLLLWKIGKKVFMTMVGGPLRVLSAVKKLGSGFGLLNKESKSLRKELEHQRKVEEAKAKGLGHLDRETKKTSRSFHGLDRASTAARGGIGKAKAKVDSLNRSMHKSNGAAGKMGKSLKGIGKGLAIGGGLIGMLVGGLLMMGADQIKELGNKVTEFVNKLPGLITELGKQLPGVIEKIAAAFPVVIQSLIDALPSVLNAIVAAIPVVIDAIGTMLPKVLDFVATMLPKVITGLLSALPKVISTLVALVPKIIDAVVKLVPALIGALVAALPAVITALAEAIPKIVTSLAEAIPKIITALAEAIPQVIVALAAAIPQIIVALLTAIPQVIVALLKAIPQIIIALLKAIPKIIVALVKAVPQIIMALVKAVPQIIEALVKAVPEIITALTEAVPEIIKAFAEAGPEIAAGFAEAFTGIFTGGLPSIDFSGIWEGFKTGLTDTWNSIIGFFTTTIPNFLSKIPEMLAKIGKKAWEFLIIGLKFYWKVVTTFYGTIWNFIKAIPGKLVELGSKAWEFLINGLKWYWNLVTTFYGTIWNFIKAIPGKLVELGSKAWEFILTGIKWYWNAVTNFYSTIWNFIKAIPGKFATLAEAVWTWLKDKLVTAWSTVTGFFTNTLIPAITGLPAKIASAASGIWNGLTSTLSSVWTTISGKFTDIVNGVLGLPARIATAAVGMWNGFTTAFKESINGIIRFWNNLNFTFPSFDGDWNGPLPGGDFKVGGWVLNTPDLPTFLAKGGVVSPSSGGTLALLAEAGKRERVEPLDPDGLSKRDKAMINMLSGGGGGMTINVYPSAGMDERELAAQVSRQIRLQMRKGAA